MSNKITTPPFPTARLSLDELTNAHVACVFQRIWKNQAGQELIGHHMRALDAARTHKHMFPPFIGAAVNTFGLIDNITLDQVYNEFVTWLRSPNRRFKMGDFGSMQYIINFMIPVALRAALGRKLGVEGDKLTETLQFCDEIAELKENGEKTVDTEKRLCEMLWNHRRAQIEAAQRGMTISPPQLPAPVQLNSERSPTPTFEEQSTATPQQTTRTRRKIVIPKRTMVTRHSRPSEEPTAEVPNETQPQVPQPRVKRAYRRKTKLAE